MEQSVDYRNIKTVEDAFSFLGLDYQAWLDARKGLPDDEIAYSELKCIVKALNGGKEVDRGYYPWFYHKSSSVGFSFGDYLYGRAYSFVCARLLLIDYERAIYAGKQFIQVYNRYINL